jgi:O-antigen ligase
LNSLILHRLSIKEVKHFIPLAILLALLAISLNQYIFYLVAVAILLFLFVLFGEKFVVVFVIVTLLTLVGDVSPSLRTVIHITDFSLLAVLFLRRFGLDWKNYPAIPKPITYFLILYYASMIVSMVMSDYPTAAMPLLFRQTAFFVTTYVLFSLIRDEQDIKLYLFALMLATSILVASSLVMFVTEGTNFFNLAGYRKRVSGLISNIDAITAFYMIVYPLTIALIIRSKNRLAKWFSGLFLIYLSLGLLLTMSRSAISGVLVSSLIMFYILKRKYFYRITVALLAVFIVIILYEPLGKFSALLFRMEAGLTSRDHLWSIALNIIKDNPVFGLGPGAYKTEVLNYFPVMFNTWSGDLLLRLFEMTQTSSNMSHNFYLFFFSEMGIFGLITATVFTVLFFKIGLRALRSYKNDVEERYYLIVALFAAGASMFVRNLVDSIGLLYYGWITADLPFWIIFICLLVYCYQLPTKNNNLKSNILTEQGKVL